MPYQRKLPMLNEIDYMSFIPPEIRQYIPGAKTAATLGVATLPGAGEGMDVQDMAQGMQNAYQGYQQGDYGMMGQGAMDTALGGLSLGAGMATLGFGPSIARMVRGPVMAAPDAVRAYKGMPAYDWKTGKQITEFKSRAPGILDDYGFNKEGAGAGFFSSDPEVASRFAKAFGEGAAVYPVDIGLKNPLVIDMGGKPAAAAQFRSVARER